MECSLLREEYSQKFIKIPQKRIKQMIKYKHYKKEGEYYVVDYCMIQENDKWVEGIVYMAVGSNKKFVRSEVEFEEKFKLI